MVEEAGVSGENTNHGQATGKLDHLRLRVECTLFCNIQNLLVIGLYELLGNNPNEAHKEIPTQVKHKFGTIYKRVNT